MHRACLLLACVLASCSGGPGEGSRTDAGGGGNPPGGLDAGADAGPDGGIPPPDAGSSDAGGGGGGGVHYAVTDLGDLGGGVAEAYAINAAGQVVGRAASDAGVYHAFLWDRTSGMRDLESPGAPVTRSSEALGINGPGEVVGVATQGGNSAFYWLPGSMPEMTGFLGPGFATGVNDTGLITGYYLSSVYTAYVRELDGGITEMPHLGTQGGNQSYANAINATGQVIGVSQTDHSIARAFLWERDGGVTDLGTMKPADNSTSVGIGLNDLGQVVGYADTDAGIVEHAFRWSPASGMEDLGSLGTGSADRSEAWGINNVGQVVGRTGTGSGAGSGLHGFVWTEASGMVDLNTVLAPGTTQILVIAQGINDRGEIVGTSHDFRALLLTPITEP